jgi:hypothetical protein
VVDSWRNWGNDLHRYSDTDADPPADNLPHPDSYAKPIRSTYPHSNAIANRLPDSVSDAIANAIADWPANAVSDRDADCEAHPV